MPTPTLYTAELNTALRAVHLAARLTKAHLLSFSSTQSRVTESTKSDASEVTVADFAAQAVIIGIVHAAFPDDEFIAEESGEMMRGDEALAGRVWELVQGAGGLVEGEQVKGLPGSLEEMVEIIDLGQRGGSGKERQGKGRTWILDPIDGTKTYIRGQQYAVCLCLVDEGEQKVGVLGCPNLNVDEVGQDGRVVIEETVVDLEPEGGWILSALKGSGTHVSRMRTPEDRMPIDKFLASKRATLEQQDAINATSNGMSQSHTDTSDPEITLRFTDSSASPHISKDIHNRIFEHFIEPASPGSRKFSVPAVEDGYPSLALDCWSMQLKYVILAFRAADAMIRTPPTSEYHAAVWDHAGGQLLLTESGGSLTDANGVPFVVDGQTRKLESNWGVCGVRGGSFVRRDGRQADAEDTHKMVLEQVRAEVGARRKGRLDSGEVD